VPGVESIAPSIRRARYATNIAAMITKAASDSSVQKGILYINPSLFTACVRLSLGAFKLAIQWGKIEAKEAVMRRLQAILEGAESGVRNGP